MKWMCNLIAKWSGKKKRIAKETKDYQETVEKGYGIKLDEPVKKTEAIDKMNEADKKPKIKKYMEIVLKRDDKFKKCTHGYWYINGVKLFDTLEEPWRDNQRDNPNTPEEEESCIPEGEYLLVKRYSPGRKKNTPYIVGTQPERDYILVHIANTTLDIKGCLAIGKGTGIYKKREAIWDSEKSFNKLMDILEESEEWKAGKGIKFIIEGKGTLAI